MHNKNLTDLRATMTALTFVLFVFSSVITLPAAAQVPPAPAGSESKDPRPKLVAPQRMQELGSVVAGDKVEVQWLLQNQGQADLVIDKTVASCGCTVVQLPEKDKVIPVGGSLQLKAEFHSAGRKGEQHKSVIVHSNDPAEPQLELQLHARVDVLYEMNPPGRMGLRAVRRGQTATDTLDISPAEGRQDIELLEVRLKDPGIFTHQAERLNTPAGRGHRIRLTLGQNAPVGYLSTGMTLKLKIGDVVKEVYVPIHGEVVEDLTVTPKVVQPSGHEALPGKQLAPVVVRSMEKTPFEIVRAQAGSHLDVTFAAASDKPAKSEYNFTLVIRKDAPQGPFGTTLEIRTDSVSQPIIRVPVFGIVAPPVLVDPPIVILRPDGTPLGTQRRVRVQTIPQQVLEVTSVKSDHPSIEAALAAQDEAQPGHVRYLDVRLSDKLPAGVDKATLSCTTNVPGAEVVQIPVVIEKSR